MPCPGRLRSVRCSTVSVEPSLLAITVWFSHSSFVPVRAARACPSLSEKSCRTALPSVAMARLAAHPDPVREDTSYRPLQPTSTSEHPKIARFLSSPQVKQRLTTFSSFSRPIRMTLPGGRAPGIAFGEALLLERFQPRAVLTNRPLTPPVAPRAGPCYRALTKHQGPFHCPCVNKTSFRDPRRLPSTGGLLRRPCKAQTTKGRLSTFAIETKCEHNCLIIQTPHPCGRQDPFQGLTDRALTSQEPA